MYIIGQLVTSFIASAGFGIIFNVPKETLIKCGYIGMLGWIVYIMLLGRGFDEILASLGASIVVTVASQLFAKRYKTPIIVFNVAGIIPLVPGGLAYDAMRNVVENQYNQAVQLAAKSFMISGAIAIGLMFSEVILLAARRGRPSVTYEQSDGKRS